METDTKCSLDITSGLSSQYPDNFLFSWDLLHLPFQWLFYMWQRWFNFGIKYQKKKKERKKRKKLGRKGSKEEQFLSWLTFSQKRSRSSRQAKYKCRSKWKSSEDSSATRRMAFLQSSETWTLGSRSSASFTRPFSKHDTTSPCECAS